jgi:hypothetical protein
MNERCWTCDKPLIPEEQSTGVCLWCDALARGYFASLAELIAWVRD